MIRTLAEETTPQALLLHLHNLGQSDMQPPISIRSYLAARQKVGPAVQGEPSKGSPSLTALDPPAAPWPLEG